MTAQLDAFRSLPSQPSSKPGAASSNPASRTNAVKHGLTATKLLPDILGRELLERHFLLMRAEWQPATPTEEVLVNELARHAAALERAAEMENAVLRCGAGAMAQLDAVGTIGHIAGTDAADPLLAAALNQDGIDRVTRYRRAHEKAWHQALKQLRELRLTARAVAPPAPPAPPFLFSEEACSDYLRERFQAPGFRCSRCGHASGYILATRDRWQCANCQHQAGLRDGTVMEGSHLSIAVWFRMIWQLMHRPDSPWQELARLSGVTRAATVNDVRAKILAALEAPDRARLLCGLVEGDIADST